VGSGVASENGGAGNPQNASQALPEGPRAIRRLGMVVWDGHRLISGDWRASVSGASSPAEQRSEWAGSGSANASSQNRHSPPCIRVSSGEPLVASWRRLYTSYFLRGVDRRWGWALYELENCGQWGSGKEWSSYGFLGFAGFSREPGSGGNPATRVNCGRGCRTREPLYARPRAGPHWQKIRIGTREPLRPRTTPMRATCRSAAGSSCWECSQRDRHRM
jgi:hypothetical protein